MKRDGELIAGFLRGSSKDLEELVKRYEKRVYYTVLHMVGNREEARDIVQETFLRMLKGLEGLKNPHKFFPWLMKIASNLVRDHFRSHFPENSHGLGEEAQLAVEEGPFDRLEGLETRERLLAALALLPPRQRMAVVLRVYNDLSFKDVAEIMDCQVATARSLFWAGVREMRKRLEVEK